MKGTADYLLQLYRRQVDNGNYGKAAMLLRLLTRYLPPARLARLHAEMRAAPIRAFLAERQVNHLVHFTHLCNVASILGRGLIPRAQLERLVRAGRIAAVTNDPRRLDNHRDASCLSLSFPNYQMFHRVRGEAGDRARWAVLLLRPDVLWKKECAFTPTNAAHQAVRTKPIDGLKSVTALKQMFADYQDGATCTPRHAHLPPCYPTNPQAEILVFDVIEPSYIQAVSVKSERVLAAARRLAWGDVPVCVDPRYFGPREDYRLWMTTAETNPPQERTAMATRPVFVPQEKGTTFVEEIDVDFRWYPGFAVQQKQRSIKALHEEAQEQHGLDALLEISSKSPSAVGRNLSAFTLELALPDGRTTTVEAAFQGSKVFAQGGPFVDLYEKTAREAKGDPRLQESGALCRFELGGEVWPLEPKTAFYDWLYIEALRQHPERAQALLWFKAFTDIEFNPRRSVNCQAHAAALYVALKRRGLLPDGPLAPDTFLRLLVGS